MVATPTGTSTSRFGTSFCAYQGALAARANITYALKPDGTVWVCGYNSSRPLGNGTTTDATRPVQVTGLAGTLAIGAGHVAAYAAVS